MIIKELLFPRRCPVCDRPTPLGEHICKDCRRQLRYIESPKCLKCGKHIICNDDVYCEDCKKIKHIFEKGLALYEYGSINKSMYRFKYKGRCEYADFFGKELAIRFTKYIKDWNIDGIIPVPMYEHKRKFRGYNQAHLIATSLSEYTKIPVYNNLIMRVRNTIPMKELDPKMRYINLKNAFIIKNFDVKLMRVIVVDDIYTTGATIDAISKVLRDAGVDKVYFLTLAIGSGI